MRLTDKQQRFAEEYLVDLNATQAAIRAGYSTSTARQIASETLSKPDVQEAIAALKAARAERTGITAEKVLGELYDIAFADPGDLIQWRISPCPECWPEEEKNEGVNAACETCHGEGRGRPFLADTRTLQGASRRLYSGIKVTKEGVSVQLRSQDKALELLGDHLGLFKKVEHKHSGVIATADLTDEAAGLSRELRAKARDAMLAVLAGKAGDQA